MRRISLGAVSGVFWIGLALHGHSDDVHQVLDRLGAELKHRPQLVVKFRYEAIANQDYAQYRFYLDTLLAKTRPSMFKHPPALAAVAAGQVLARIDAEFAGTPDDFVLSLNPDKTIASGNPALKFDSTVLYDGTSYLVRTHPGQYVSLQADFLPAIASYLDVIDCLPPYLPDSLLPIPMEASRSYPQLIADLLKDKTTSVVRQKNNLVVDGLLRGSTDPATGNQSARRISVEIGTPQGAPPCVESVHFHDLLLRNGKIVTEYAGSTITFSDFELVNGAPFPKSISAACTSSLFDFNGDSVETNAQRLGLPVSDLKRRTFAVITHTYTCSDIEGLPASAKPALSLTKGEEVVNRYDGTYIHVPQDIQVTAIGTFLRQEKPFTNYQFHPAPE